MNTDDEIVRASMQLHNARKDLKQEKLRLKDVPADKPAPPILAHLRHMESRLLRAQQRFDAVMTAVDTLNE